MMYGIGQFAYLIASACFIFALHWMNTPATARNGVYAGIAGTVLAILATWVDPKPREITVSIPPDKFAKQR